MAATAVDLDSTKQETGAGVHGAAGASALVKAGDAGPVSSGSRIDRGSVVCRMPVEVEVGVPVREFRVRDLLALLGGAVVRSQWSQGDDLPLAAGHVQLAWVQFEVLDSVLAARITRPA